MEPTSWLKAKDVMFAALARPAEEREAFVRERCADPAVCAEILEVLATAPGTAEHLSQGVRTQAPATEAAAESPLELGTSVGPYVIVDRIGRGGMGQVFLGTDPRLQRRVALKCLLDSRSAGADVRSRIIHEARAAARISSQHVAVVHDVVEHDSRAFIVMEYVEGETLAARIRKGALPVDEAIAIGRQIAAALAAAHAEGIVHRDLKPGNVQVTPSGVVKILDFGIASATRLLTPALPTPAGTAAGIDTGAVMPRLAGTAPYMSPEQLLGRPIDERSDLYSLGTVLFEMCTGQRAYAGRDAIEVAVAQATSTPRADAIDPDIPRPLADVIARAMAVDADERFASATAMDEALAQVEHALAEPLSRRQRAARMAIRVAVGLPVAAIVVAIIGVITTLQFNGLFGRDGEFARFGREPWPSWIGFGLLGIVPVVVVMTGAAVAAVALRFTVGLLLLIPSVRTAARRVRVAGGRLVHEAGLDRSTPAAQALTGLAVATLAVFFWRYSELIGAYTSFFNSSPIAQLLPMTDSAPARTQYHIELGLITLVFGYALHQVVKLRRRERARDGRVAIVLLGVVVAMMVLLNEIPYRAFHRRDFERVDLAGARCYITGQSGDELLVLCPGSPPPRNRVVRRDDPQLRRLGIIENVFKGIDTAAVLR